MREYEVSDTVERALEVIDGTLNGIQDDYESPFGNTGASFKNDTFHVQAYSWTEDDQPFNFKWKHIKIKWYKYAGRGMTSNVDITPRMCRQMLKSCLRSLL